MEGNVDVKENLRLILEGECDQHLSRWWINVKDKRTVYYSFIENYEEFFGGIINSGTDIVKMLYNYLVNLKEFLSEEDGISRDSNFENFWRKLKEKHIQANGATITAIVKEIDIAIEKNSLLVANIPIEESPCSSLSSAVLEQKDTVNELDHPVKLKNKECLNLGLDYCRYSTPLYTSQISLTPKVKSRGIARKNEKQDRLRIYCNITEKDSQLLQSNKETSNSIFTLNANMKITNASSFPFSFSVAFSPVFKYEEEEINTNIIYNNQKNSSSSREYVQYISLDLFLKKIATENKNFTSSHSTLISGFVQQYSSFITTDILIEKILSAFQFFREFFSNSVLHLTGLVDLLNCIILAHYEDFIKNNNKLVEELKSFYTEMINLPDVKGELELETSLSLIKDIFEHNNTQYDLEFTRLMLKGRKKSHQNVTFKFENKNSRQSTDRFNIIYWSDLDIARQLTLFSRQQFSKIEDKELIACRFSKKEKYKTSINVMKVIHRCEALSLFIIEEILSYDYKKDRARLIEKFIRIASECKKLGNFNDSMTITSALDNFIIKGLSKTWAAVKPEYVQVLNRLNSLFSFEGNYRNLRIEAQQYVGHAYIPYLGMLLKELAYIEEGPKYIKDSYLINCEKIEVVANTLSSFMEFKSHSYLFRPIEDLSILDNIYPKKEIELESIANSLEPVFTLDKSKHKKKRRTSTDAYYYKVTTNSQDKEVSSSNWIQLREDFFQ